MDWGDIATWVGAVAAVAAAGAAVRAEHRAKKSAASAASEAQRAITAAEQSANAQQRLADLAEAAANKYVPPWTLQHRAGDTYEVVNAGDERVYDVTVSGSCVNDGPKRTDYLDPKSSISFFGIHAGVGEDLDEGVTVMWRRTPESDGELHEWRNSLPPKR